MSANTDDVTRERVWSYDPGTAPTFNLDVLKLRHAHALRRGGANQFQWLSSRVFPSIKSAAIDTTLLLGFAIVEFALHVMAARDRELRIFAVNDCEWWAGWDLQHVLETFAKANDYYNVKAATADGMIENPHELSADDLDRIKFVHDEGDPMEMELRGHLECTFRERLAEMIQDGDTFPCMFASTEQ